MKTQLTSIPFLGILIVVLALATAKAMPQIELWTNGALALGAGLITIWIVICPGACKRIGKTKLTFNRFDPPLHYE